MPAPADAIRMLPAKPQRARRPLAAALTSGKTPSSLVTWYLGLTHHWMGDNPRVKTRILLAPTSGSSTACSPRRSASPPWQRIFGPTAS